MKKENIMVIILAIIILVFVILIAFQGKDTVDKVYDNSYALYDTEVKLTLKKDGTLTYDVNDSSNIKTYTGTYKKVNDKIIGVLDAEDQKIKINYYIFKDKLCKTKNCIDDDDYLVLAN